MRKISKALMVGLALLISTGCEQASDLNDMSPLATQARFPDRAFPISEDFIDIRPMPNPDRNAYYGDLHVHTTYSFDAYAFGTLATPRDAYRYAMGEALEHPAGFDMQLREPLDFYAVTDHALFLGLAAEAADTSSAFSQYEVSEPLHDLNEDGNRGLLSAPARLQIFGKFVPGALAGMLDGSIDRGEAVRVAKSAWLDIVESADEFYIPGTFTTFAGYEYTSSSDDSGNLHRNVIFRDTNRLPAEPFSRFHSRDPEGLWDWMDGLREQGIESLAIPHNSNGSNGQMFKLVDWAENPMDDDYTTKRVRNEPLVEITQVKGTSETHPSLSETDEWADFELMEQRVGTTLFSKAQGGYVREALRNGLSFEENGITNPYKFGFVGASDTHTGATSDDESNYFAKIGLLDSTPELRGSIPLPWWFGVGARMFASDLVADVDGETYFNGPGTNFGASGLAAVWAEENTRDSIYDAFRRKETFATSGPRIRVRLFAGYGWPDSLLNDPQVVATAYETGVTMGADLQAEASGSPVFLAWAVRDALSAPLQRLQIIKGWVEDGETAELVYDVACSDGASPDPATRRCPDNGAQVDLKDCSYSQDKGAGELRASWRDPDFDPAQRAFYYVRALENPTCRWSTWDALRAGVPPRSDLPVLLQERAWSSPIWVLPESSVDTTAAAPDENTAQPRAAS